jgi:hypothetical protein
LYYECPDIKGRALDNDFGELYTLIGRVPANELKKKKYYEATDIHDLISIFTFARVC